MRLSPARCLSNRSRIRLAAPLYGELHCVIAEAYVVNLPSDSIDLIALGCGQAGGKAGAQAAYFGKSRRGRAR